MERPFDYCQDYTYYDSLNFSDFELKLLDGLDFNYSKIFNEESDNLLYISDDEFKRSSSFLNDVEVIVNNSYLLKSTGNTEIKKSKIKKSKIKKSKIKKKKSLPKQDKILKGKKKKIYVCDKCGRNNFINGHALGGHKKYCKKTEYYN